MVRYYYMCCIKHEYFIIIANFVQEKTENGNLNLTNGSAENIQKLKEAAIKTNGSHHQENVEETEHDEMQYLNLIHNILKRGITRGDRTSM